MPDFAVIAVLLWSALAAVWVRGLFAARRRAQEFAYPALPILITALWFISARAGWLSGLLAAALAVWALLTLVWLLSLAARDASLMDIAYPWVPLAALAGSLPELSPRTWLIGIAVALWTLRLSLHLAVRNLPRGEDPRYAKWRARHGAGWWWWSYFQVFLLQGVLVWLWSVPLLLAGAQRADISWTDSVAAGVVIAGVLVEGAADWQLARFRADAANRGRLLDTGLFAWSRHPNYFGEALVRPWGWVAIVFPAYVTWFMNQGSAARMTDGWLPKTRTGYAEYMAAVPTFFPRPPRPRSPPARSTTDPS